MSLHDRIRKLEARAEGADAPTPEEFLAADRRGTARLHRKMAEEWGMRGMFTDEDRDLLEGDGAEQAEADADIIHRWRVSQGVTDEVIAAMAERAREKLLGVGKPDSPSDS